MANSGTVGGSYDYNSATNSLVIGRPFENMVVIWPTGTGGIAAPEIVSIRRDAQTGVVTIHYESISGVVFGVAGSTELADFGIVLPDTAVGNGAVMTYTHTPPASAKRFFYRLSRN